MSDGMPSSRLHALASQIRREYGITQHMTTEPNRDLNAVNSLFQRLVGPEVAAVYHMDWTHDELTQVPIHDESGHVLGHVPIYGGMTVGNFSRMIRDELSVTYEFELKVSKYMFTRCSHLLERYLTHLPETNIIMPQYGDAVVLVPTVKSAQ